MKPPKKYGNGGKITPEEYKKAQNDSLILNKAALKSDKIPYYQDKKAANALIELNLLREKMNAGPVESTSKNSLYQNSQNGKIDNGGYNVAFPKPTMIPYTTPKENIVVEKKPITINPITNEPQRKPVIIGTAGTFNPNNSKTYQEPSMINEINTINQKYKKGGLVKFIKGYAEGGQTEDNSKEVAAAIGMGAGMLGNFGSDTINATTQDVYGRTDTGSKLGDYSAGIGSGLMSGAGKGAAAGAALGPYGVLIGAGLGAATGIATGAIKTKKDRDSIQAEKDEIELNKIKQKQLEAKQNFDYTRNKALQERQAGLKSGGMVMKAPQYKSSGGKIEGAGTGKSDSIKAKVKEDSFVVPVENTKVAEQIRKIVLRAPSPKKKANLNQKNGEDVMLSNGEHLFTPKEVEKIERTLGDDVLDKLAPNSAKQEDILEGENPEMKGGGEVKGGDKEKRKQYLQNQISNLLESQSSLDKLLLKKYQKELASLSSGNTNTVTEVKKSKIPNTGLSVETMKQLKPSMDNVVVEGEKPNVVPQQGQGNANDLRQDAVLKSDKGSNKSDNGNKIDKLKALGIIGNEVANLGTGLVNYVIPAKQTRMGLEFLSKAGARPVDTVDAGFQDTVNKANANAKFGYTPEEQAYLNMQNANLLNAQKAAARNYSGGSSGNAYAMERDASNESFGRGLEATIAGRKLQMNKQQYADNLNMAKADKMRQLFDDRMEGWNANQKAGGALVGAGLRNMIGANRYSQELIANQATNNIGNSWLNNIGG